MTFQNILASLGLVTDPVSPEGVLTRNPKNMKRDRRDGGKESDEDSLSQIERIFLDRYAEVRRNPDSLTNRIWLLLEVPTSSYEARTIQIFLIFGIVISVFVLYTETLTTWTTYGEGTAICGHVLQKYVH